MQRAGQRLLAMFRSHLDAVSRNEFGIGDADEAEHPAQIGFEVLADRRYLKREFSRFASTIAPLAAPAYTYRSFMTGCVLFRSN